MEAAGASLDLGEHEDQEFVEPDVPPELEGVADRIFDDDAQCLRQRFVSEGDCHHNRMH